MLCCTPWTMLWCTQWIMLCCTPWTMLSTSLFSHGNNVVAALFNHQYCYNLLTRSSNNVNNDEQACSINIVFSCSNNRWTNASSTCKPNLIKLETMNWLIKISIKISIRFCTQRTISKPKNLNTFAIAVMKNDLAARALPRNGPSTRTSGNGLLAFVIVIMFSFHVEPRKFLTALKRRNNKIYVINSTPLWLSTRVYQADVSLLWVH